MSRAILGIAAFVFAALIVPANAAEIVRIPQRAMIEWRAGQPNAENTIYAGAGLSIRLSRVRGAEEGTFIPVLRLKSANGEEIVAPGAEQFGATTATFAIGELDPTNDGPEVLFMNYTGGAHCCTRIAVLSHTAAGGWTRADVGTFDGEPDGRFPRDLDSDGIPEIVRADQNFLYAFDGYAGSASPPVVFQIRYGRVIDASKDTRYARLFQKDLALWKAECLRHHNGACAAFVADAARLGIKDQAWAIMLRNYDRHSTWALPVGCNTLPLPGGDCPDENKLTFSDFPAALKWFLDFYGY